jgi:hypothetical protein
MPEFIVATRYDDAFGDGNLAANVAVDGEADGDARAVITISGNDLIRRRPRRPDHHADTGRTRAD